MFDFKCCECVFVIFYHNNVEYIFQTYFKKYFIVNIFKIYLGNRSYKIIKKLLLKY